VGQRALRLRRHDLELRKTFGKSNALFIAKGNSDQFTAGSVIFLISHPR
jgi:hypothetical protein